MVSRNLITGGLGFYGSYLARRLTEKGEEVVIFDLAAGSRFIRDIKDKLKVVQGDLKDRAQVMAAVGDNGIDCIYHLAALMPPKSEQDLAAAFELNVGGTVHILEAARQLNVGSVIFVSTLFYKFNNSRYFQHLFFLFLTLSHNLLLKVGRNASIAKEFHPKYTAALGHRTQVS